VVPPLRPAALLSLKATRPAAGANPDDFGPGFEIIEDEPAEVLEMSEDGVTPAVVVPRVELTLEWLVESPPPEHTWEEPPIFYDGACPACHVIITAIPAARFPIVFLFLLSIAPDIVCARCGLRPPNVGAQLRISMRTTRYINGRHLWAQLY